jgi:hypothetical protein
VGAVAGLGGAFAYNHHMTGAWLQRSAEVKHLLSSLTSPFNPVPAIWQFLRVLFYAPPLDLSPRAWALALHIAAAVLLAAIAAATAMTLRSGHWLNLLRAVRFIGDRVSAGQEMALIASLLGVAGYLMLDGFNSQATYGWYTSAVTGFILILAGEFFDSLAASTAAAIVFPLMLLNIAAAQWRGGNAASQMQEVYIGEAMHAEHAGARMGGGDVGKPSFYNDGTMFNLDGLMNNEVVPDLAAGKIHCYLLRRHIEYISDLGSVTQLVTDAERVKLGYRPVPWDLYLTRVYAKPVPGPGGAMESVTYARTNFDAIRASGECPAGD